MLLVIEGETLRDDSEVTEDETSNNDESELVEEEFDPYVKFFQIVRFLLRERKYKYNFYFVIFASLFFLVMMLLLLCVAKKKIDFCSLVKCRR